VLREKMWRQWNQPVLWPVGIAVVLLVLSLAPAVATLRRRERATAQPAAGYLS
jgi:hypothetical protein